MQGTPSLSGGGDLHMTHLCRLLLGLAAGTAASHGAVTVGPDSLGYLGSQASDPGGFQSIAGNPAAIRRTPAGLTRDDYTFQVPVGFDFRFYGTPYTEAFVSTNGFVSFGGLTSPEPESGSYHNPDLSQSTILMTGGVGAPDIEQAVIAPFWDDLFFSSTQPGALYTLSRQFGGISEFVVEWSGVQFFTAQTTPLTIQTILRSDGSFSFYYPDVQSSATGSLGAEASIGLHDAHGGGSANRFLQYSYNAASLRSGDVIHFSIVPEPATSFTVAAGLAGLLLYRKRGT